MIIALLTAALLEVLVRLCWPQPPPQLWLVPSPRYGHLGRPNLSQTVPMPGRSGEMHVRTNSLGFRDAEMPPPEPDLPVIVFAGDSFTFGHGVEVNERFDTLLREQLLAAGHRVRTVNLGMSAWGTIQETRYLLDHLDALRPEAIVLTFCINDPYDDAYFLEHGISFDRVRFPGKDFLRQHSHLFRALQAVYLSTRKARIMTAEARGRSQRSGTPPQPAPPGSTEPPAAAPPISQDAWQRTRDVLMEFALQLERRRPGTRIFFQSTDPLNTDIRDHLQAIARELPHAEYVDWADAAATLLPGERFISEDGHWPPAMHRLSAAALAGRLP